MGYPTFNSSVKNERGDNGASNAAILTFNKDVIDSLIKELTQNSIDAKKSKESKLKIKINVIDIDKSLIPNFDKFEIILNSIVKYWENKDKSSHYIFSKALEYINLNKQLKTFVFEDFETKGLTGDLERGSFKSLVFDEGTSSDKGIGSLGGHGIGKNAVFGFSNIRSLIYSSLNGSGEYKFMGISKLGEYCDINGLRRSHRIYYGKWGNDIPNREDDLTPITQLENIPLTFRRYEAGLSCYALGIKIDPELDWSHSVKEAFLKNYWFLLETDKIEIQIGDFLLSKSNYYELAIEMFDKENYESSVLPYIKAYLTPDLHENVNISHIGNVNYYFKEADDEINGYPNKVIYLRDGMMIKSERPGVSSLPNKIAGVIFCDNDKGNEILGRMEPPAHNDFIPNLLQEKMPEYTEKDGKKILKELKSNKEIILNKIKEKYKISTTSLESVDELLSGLIYQTDDNIQAPNKHESFTKKTIYQENDYLVKNIINYSLINNASQTVSTDEVIESSGGGGRSNNDSDGGLRGDLGNNNEDGDSNSIKNEINTSNSQTKSKKNKITTRMFHNQEIELGNEYILNIKSKNENENIKIQIFQHGDSKGSMTSILNSVIYQGRNIGFKNFADHVIIDSIHLQNDNVLVLQFIENQKSAFKLNLLDE